MKSRYFGFHYAENELFDLSDFSEIDLPIHARHALLTPSATSSFIQGESVRAEFDIVENVNFVNFEMTRSRITCQKFEEETFSNFWQFMGHPNSRNLHFRKSRIRLQLFLSTCFPAFSDYNSPTRRLGCAQKSVNFLIDRIFHSGHNEISVFRISLCRKWTIRSVRLLRDRFADSRTPRSANTLSNLLVHSGRKC